MILKNQYFAVLAIAFLALPGCKSKSKGMLQNDGQVHGVAPSSRYTLPKPPGMVYIPQGTFHMGPSDEDPSYAFSARNRSVSISGFWMDQTEITNNQYRQFTNWVRDSIAGTKEGLFGKGGQGGGGQELLDWNKIKTFKWNLEKYASADLVVPADQRVKGILLNASKLVYASKVFDYAKAARRENAGKDLTTFIVKKEIQIYPDTLVWVRDFAYSYNEPMMKRYYSHPAFGNYPVVGISWKQAVAFCEWRTDLLNSYLESKKRSQESDFRLPTEAQWEYAARGGRSQSMFPWGNYYLRNKKGCLLANFKPGRGNYPEDGGLYTVRADAYWPNDYGLYNMSGNVAEWTSSIYYEGGYTFQHDMNPDVRYDAADTDPPKMKRKVIRGGSWKDVGYYLQTSARTYEYQDSGKSYIGFRSVIDLPAQTGRHRK